MCNILKDNYLGKMQQLFTFQKNLEKSDNLLRLFEDIHNHLYANDGFSQQEALEEIIKILFIKIYDEKKKIYSFKINTKEYTEILEGEKNPSFLNKINYLKKESFNYFSSLFDIEEKLNLKATSLAYIVNKLQKVDLLNSASNIKGIAFQKFIHSSLRTGRGQFFTPEQVVKLCVDIIKPNIFEKILDPACGSGGFLTYVIRYVLEKEKPNNKQFLEYVNRNIYGIEISRYAARLSKMMMILEGDGFSKIIQYDSLAEWSQLNYNINKNANKDQESYEEFFDVILTNPPFGTQGRIANKSILRNYELGYKWVYKNNKWNKTNEILKGQVPDILFLERCLQFLKPGGRLAIVLPNGNLENKSLGYVRQYFLEKARVLAVIKLPQETFIPSGTGVKTSILFLQKNSLEDPKRKNIFFGEIKKLGYIGNKNGSTSYKKDIEGNILKNKNGESVIDEDVSKIVNKYNEYAISNNLEIKNGHKQNYFLVNIDDIKTRIDLTFYKPKYRDLEKTLTKKGALKLGEIVSLKKDKSLKLEKKDNMVEYIELSDVSIQYNEIINSTIMKVHDLPSRASYELRKGDIITAVAGNSIGTRKHVSALVGKDYDGAICTNGFRVLIPNDEIVYIYYLLFYLKINKMKEYY